MTPLSGLITGGLGLPACQGMIVNRFHLFGCGVSVSVGKENYGGGPYPRPAWNQVSNIQNFYKPVDPNYYLQQNLDGRKTHHVIVTITINETTTTKEYLVRERTANIVAKIVDVVNNSLNRIRVAISAVKRTTGRIVNVMHIIVKRNK